jgi:hypothetical protein
VGAGQEAHLAGDGADVFLQECPPDRPEAPASARSSLCDEACSRIWVRRSPSWFTPAASSLLGDFVRGRRRALGLAHLLPHLPGGDDGCMASWPWRIASRTTSSGTSMLAPASTMRMASRGAGQAQVEQRCVPSWLAVGLKTRLRPRSPTRTAPMGPRKGMSEMVRAAEAPMMPRMSSKFSPSAESAVTTTWTSLRNPLGEEGADRPVNQACRQDGLFSGPAFPAEETAGDLPGRVQPLFVIHGEGEEVFPLPLAGGHGRCSQEHGVPAAQRHGPASLIGQPAGLQCDGLLPKGSGQSVTFHFVNLRTERAAQRLETGTCPARTDPLRNMSQFQTSCRFRQIFSGPLGSFPATCAAPNDE